MVREKARAPASSARSAGILSPAFHSPERSPLKIYSNNQAILGHDLLVTAVMALFSIGLGILLAV